MSKRMNGGMFSSSTDDWETPGSVFDALHKEFGFCLDVCASAKNTKLPHSFITAKEDGLVTSWRGRSAKGDICWMNPPYGRAIGEWVRKAYVEARLGATVVCLLPARVDTKWWHDYVMQAKEIRLIQGRLKFGKSKNSAPFPSCIVVFTPDMNHRKPPTFSSVTFNHKKNR